jgi:hypothetical protein
MSDLSYLGWLLNHRHILILPIRYFGLLSSRKKDVVSAETNALTDFCHIDGSFLCKCEKFDVVQSWDFEAD